LREAQGLRSSDVRHENLDRGIWGQRYLAKTVVDVSIPETLGFFSFIGGFLAKSILDLVKGLFKRVFAA
jgi:hypothetical protein